MESEKSCIESTGLSVAATLSHLPDDVAVAYPGAGVAASIPLRKIQPTSLEATTALDFVATSGQGWGDLEAIPPTGPFSPHFNVRGKGVPWECWEVKLGICVFMPPTPSSRLGSLSGGRDFPSPAQVVPGGTWLNWVHTEPRAAVC